MTGRLDGKRAVITGGTTGIGFATAERFLKEGAKVLTTGRTQPEVDTALEKLSGDIHGLAADCRTLSEIDAMAVKAKELFGTVDILVANAGVGKFCSIVDTDEASYDQIFDLNLKGLFFTVNKILPLMECGGSIILLSSAINIKGTPQGSLYNASKAGVRSFARSFAAELGPQGIRVNSLSPGLIPTNFANNANIDGETYQGFIDYIVATAPLGRVGAAEEIAAAATFLASDEAGYITAEDLVVDGGYMNV